MLHEKLVVIEACLSKRMSVKCCLRVNIVPESMIQQRSTCKVALCESNTLRMKEKKETHIMDLIEGIDPEWWGDETKIMLNRNVKRERHRDGNDGLSWIIWLGDFIGGALVFDDGRRVAEKNIRHQIDNRVRHWNEPHEGTKYSIILYHSNRKSKSSRMVEKKKWLKAKRNANAEAEN